jgi:NAD(P)-dependent dehydrogenase (short-subunit alcohol dehydrogenase family)
VRKVALVTGATRGIGKAAAIEVARRGFAVAVTGRTRREGEGRLGDANLGNIVAVPGSIETTVREIEALGGEAFGIELDIGSRASIDATIDAVLHRWGRLDGLFNNAMYQSPYAMSPIAAINADIAEVAMRSMFINHLHITQRALEPMLKQGAGRIVFISSGAGVTLCELKLDQGGWGMLYGAGKAAFSKLAEFIDLEYRDQGIATFHIQPGLTITEAMLAQYGDAAKDFGGGQPVYTPEETGRTVAWMLDAPTAPTYAGPTMHFAPTFFADNDIEFG